MAEHQKKIGNNDPIFLDRLMGYLNYWHSIEPENKFVNNSLESLSSVRAKKRNVDIGEAPAVPELEFEGYHLVMNKKEGHRNARVGETEWAHALAGSLSVGEWSSVPRNSAALLCYGLTASTGSASSLETDNCTTNKE